MNYWIDLENPYVTLEDNYIESVWWSLKELHKKKLLYEGYKVVPFCPRCGTPLSSHEVAQGYKDVKEDSVYIAFKLKDKKGEYILAWTTTPWTLPGNVGLAVGPKVDYVKVELEDGDKLILGKEKLDLIKGKYKVVEKMKGKDLVGLEYEPLYDIPETQNENSHKVISADFVTTEDGTGVVHTAVMYGEDDYQVGLKEGLPAVHTVGQDGKFLDIVPDFIRGKFVKSAEKDIKEDLKKRHLLFKVEKINHSYPHCWRCDSALLYYGINSWFIQVTKIRDKLIKNNQKINWYPGHIKDGRFGKWLEGVKDWSLSRFKFWGTPLPIWRNVEDPEDVIVIGSREELEKLSGKKLKDLHKPEIDKIKFEKDGKKYERVSDVIDCWYDSGAASFAQFHYPFENKEEFEKRFPYNFISEAIDQTRGWFYTLHVLGTALFDKPAYKNVICAGHVVNEKGEKMSKSKGNIIKPRDIIDKTGVDAVRLQFCTSDAGNQKRYSFDLMRESVIPFLTVLYNSHNYYNQLDKKKGTLAGHVEDKWILSKLNSLVEGVTKDLESYDTSKSFDKIMNFVVKDFSRGYIKMTRNREDTKEILGEVLEKVALLIAPFAPYISEYVYNNFSKDSVHLSSWPKVDKKRSDGNLEAIFDQTLQIIEKGLSERDKIQIGLKWPLQKATVFVKGSERFEDVKELIKSQLNVKDIEFDFPASKSTELVVELDTKVTPELEAEGYARELSRQVQAFRKKLGLNKKDRIELSVAVDDDFKVILEPHKNYIAERTGAKKVEFVTTGKENFKNSNGFRIKERRGVIGIITTG